MLVIRIIEIELSQLKPSKNKEYYSNKSVYEKTFTDIYY